MAVDVGGLLLDSFAFSYLLDFLFSALILESVFSQVGNSLLLGNSNDLTEYGGPSIMATN